MLTTAVVENVRWGRYVSSLDHISNCFLSQFHLSTKFQCVCIMNVSVVDIKILSVFFVGVALYRLLSLVTYMYSVLQCNSVNILVSCVSDTFQLFTCENILK